MHRMRTCMMKRLQMLQLCLVEALFAAFEGGLKVECARGMTRKLGNRNFLREWQPSFSTKGASTCHVSRNLRCRKFFTNNFPWFETPKHQIFNLKVSIMWPNTIGAARICFPSLSRTPVFRHIPHGSQCLSKTFSFTVSFIKERNGAPPR